MVGAGIGGLTAAVALHRQGWRVTVLERARTLEPVGAGLGLAPNALHALDAIGLGDDVRRFSAVQGQGGIRTPGGRWLVRTDLSALAEPVRRLRSAWPCEPTWSALLAAGCRTARCVTGVTVTGVDAGRRGPARARRPPARES